MAWLELPEEWKRRLRGRYSQTDQLEVKHGSVCDATGGRIQAMAAPGGDVRIIAGAWRSRRIRFPAAAGLRPTPDRLRETLFNWLGPWIEGRRVLDLYAGSGALGIEALSRGAREAVFVERARATAMALRENLLRFGAGGARVECRDALGYLRGNSGRFDLVFLDPPWASDLVVPSLKALLAGEILSADHRVYVEERAASSPNFPPLPWRRLSKARVGEAAGSLLAASAFEGEAGRGS